MKKIIRIAIIALVALISVNSAARDRIVTYENLPTSAKTFITTHFPGVQVSYAIRDDGRYEVKTADGIEMEFSRKGEWKKVDCKTFSVPNSVIALIPKEIDIFVTANYPNAVIVKIDKKLFGIEIELDNDLEIVFGRKGQPRRVDD